MQVDYQYVEACPNKCSAIADMGDRLATIDMDRKLGAVPLWGGEAGSRPVCLFKARLDKFWMHQVVKYDFTADLTGIGDRSVHDISVL